MRTKVAYKSILICGFILALTTNSIDAEAQGLGNYAPTYSEATSNDSTTKSDTSVPKLAIKTNLAQLAIGVSNIGLEIPIKRHFSVDIPLTYSPYTIKSDWKYRLLILQPEVRYWFSDHRLRGHFLGLHAHAGYFNVAFDNENRYQNRSDEPLWGYGLSYGYALKLSKAMNMEFNIGAGYTSMRYDIYYNYDNGAQYDYETMDYWGITRVGISLTYTINNKNKNKK